MKSLEEKYFKLLESISENETIYKSFDDFMAILGKIQTENPLFILDQLNSNNYSRKNIIARIHVAEFIRREGILYTANTTLINSLLTVCLQLVDDYNKTKNTEGFLFVKKVFDIIFHQVNIIPKEGFENEANDETRKLYIQLSYELLDEKYYSLYSKNDDGFYNCIYFILMIAWDENLEKDFLKLWKKIQYYLDDYGRDDPICETWIEAFEVLIKNKKLE